MAPVTTTPLVPTLRVHVKLLLTSRSNLLPRFSGEQWILAPEDEATATMISGPT